MTWFVGADWDKAKCVVEGRRGDEVVRRTVKRDPDAVVDFVKELRAGKGEAVVVGIEAGDRLWRLLWVDAGADVFEFDAAKAKNYAKSLCSSKASSDRASAASLCSQVSSATHRETANETLSSEDQGALLLLRGINNDSELISVALNQLWTLLQQYWPDFLSVCGDLKSKWVHRFLQAVPTPTALSALRAPARADALALVTKGRRQDIVDTAQRCFVPISAQEDRAARLRIRCTVRQLQAALERQSEQKAELDRLYGERPEVQCARSVRGLGVQLGTGLAVLLNVADSERDAAGVRSGVSPVTQASGTRGEKRPTVRVRRTSSVILRRTAYLAAVQLVKHHRWAKAQFAHYRARGDRGPTAYRKVARSFLRILAALVKRGQDFDEDLYIQRCRSKKAAWALELEP